MKLISSFESKGAATLDELNDDVNESKKMVGMCK